MNQTCQKILLASAFGLALSACSSTGTSYDNSMGNSDAGATSSGTTRHDTDNGNSSWNGTSGTTSSGTSATSGTTTSGASVRTTPPASGSTSSSGVIDDRINGKPDVPGANH